MKTDRYKTYTADDFIFDEDFREIVRRSELDDQLHELIESMPEKRYEINLAVRIIRSLHVKPFTQSAQRKKELWEQIANKKKKQFSMSFMKYAASLLLLLGVGGSMFYFGKKDPVKQLSVVKQNPSDNTMLILANGETVSITSKQSTIQYSADGTGVTVNDSSGVAQSVAGNGMNKMIVPYGKRSTITLSDGTKVWLNSGSSLVFPPAFKGNKREVILVGEAFFDVTHNKHKPFFVKTDAFKMKVYGTKFDVKAYQQDKDYNIVLVEGKVSLNPLNDLKAKEVFLAPNQKATILKGDKNFAISEVENIDTYTSWIDGYLTFRNEDVSVLLKQVSRYYKADIEIDLANNPERIYGKLDLKDDLERVLDGIAFISKTKFKKEGNKYVFYE